MKPNCGMIQKTDFVVQPVRPEPNLATLEQVLALHQWMQGQQKTALPVVRRQTLYTTERSPMELRLYALFAD